MRYPDQVNEVMFNLLDSHDTELRRGAELSDQGRGYYLSQRINQQSNFYTRQ